jgi:hypothetical protein
MIIILGVMVFIVLVGALLFYKTKGSQRRTQEKIGQVSHGPSVGRASGSGDD